MRFSSKTAAFTVRRSPVRSQRNCPAPHRAALPIETKSNRSESKRGGGSRMLQTFLDSLFGCAHQRTTFPITRGRKLLGAQATAAANRTYVVCLDCGKEFAYDWKAMRVGDAVDAPPASRAAQAFYR